MTKKYDVLGVANPFVDYVMRIENSFLQEISAIKGGWEEIDDQTFSRILSTSHEKVSQVAGGSGTNAIKGLAKLGNRCALMGKLGKDQAGKAIAKQLAHLGITPLYHMGSDATGHVLCLVTPDGERTMRTYLGAAGAFLPEELTPEVFHQARLVHIEGYLVLNPPVITRAMQLAKEANALLSFDMANFEIIEDKRELFLSLIETYCDIVFANEKEIFALTGLEPEEGCRWLQERVEIAVILRGIKGCLVGHNSKVEAFPTFPVLHPLDTTGAGDLFASGFLHGYLGSKTLEESARLGALLASTVIQFPGAEIPPDIWGSGLTF